MEIVLTVCNECGKKHGAMIAVRDEAGEPVYGSDGNPILIGNRSCFLAWQGKRWTRMEEEHRHELSESANVRSFVRASK